MKYRPDIDGLRALAVLAVVFYHAKLGSLSGGYLGVDVFFVISGFLITKNILSEQASKQFTVGGFYVRRARRILPILFAVLAVSSFFAWQYLLPSDLVEYASSVLSTLAFVSNIFFYFQDNYHAAESATKPLLHTWSLGVEEQFYLLFPMLLICIEKYSTIKRIIILVLIALISLCFAVYASTHLSEFNFYMLPSRLWELMSGSLLAFYFSLPRKKTGNFNGSVIALPGLLIILVSLLIISSDEPHPSLLTLAPVLGAVAVIGWGNQCRFTSIILGNMLMAWVGRLSYSIYLWHFPVFAFAYIKSNDDLISFSDKLELLALTLFLSVIGHYLIEKPFRNSERVGRKFFFISLVTGLIFLVVWSSFVIKNKGVENRLGDIESIFRGADRSDSFLLKDGKRCYFLPWVTNSCRFDDFENGLNIIAMGDSHSNMLSVPLKEMATNQGANFYNMVLSHCPYVVDAWRSTGFKAKCETSQMAKVKAYLESIPPSVIVYTARWPMYLNANRFDNGEGGIERSLFFPLTPNNEAQARGELIDDLIIKTFNEMGEYGHKVILVYPTPEVGWHVPKLIKERLDKVSDLPLGRKRKAFEEMAITTSYNVYKERNGNSRAILDRITNTNVSRVYPDKLFCSEESGRCITHDHEKIFYYDDDHLSFEGGKLVVEEIEAAIFNTQGN
ncbi:MAG: peptidoglycan/LPS O-acetylase OafA/YrhL [Flavobacteriales bacterium]